MEQLLTKEEQAALDRVKPICAECKHYIENEFRGPECARTDSINANKITGRVGHSYHACDTERKLGLQGSCGSLGKHFEPKPINPTWIERLIAWVN